MKKPLTNKQWKKKCDILWSVIIRTKDYCEHPDCSGNRANKLVAAHIIPRGYNHTRHLIDNGLCLCWYCHIHRFHADPIRTEEFVVKKIGRKKLNWLKKKSLEKGKIFYEDVYKELLKIQQLGKEPYEL